LPLARGAIGDKANNEINSGINIMFLLSSLRSYRSLATSLALALVLFAGTSIVHAQEMDLNEFEALVGTGQTSTAISREQAIEMATGGSDADIELLSDYFASNGRDAEGVAKMASDMIRELAGSEHLVDAAERIADAATDALNAQYITRFEDDEDFSLPEAAIGFDFATPDSKQISGYERATPNDDRLETDTVMSGLRRPTDKPVVAHGIVGVKKFSTEMPNGIYRVTLITDDLGDWTKTPRPFGNRIRVNDKIARVLTKDLRDWILDSGKKGSSPLGGREVDFSEKGLQFPRIDPEVMAGNAQNYGDPVGRVDTVKGFATVVRVDGQTETLSLGDPIYKGDKLATGTGSSLGLLLGDETTVAMGDKAEMVLDDLVYNPEEESGNLSISILDGLFTMNTGKIASTDPQAMIVRTPRAMSAIRGTNPGFDVDATSGTENFFNLPDANTGAFGSFSVTSTTSGGELLLSGDFDIFLLDENGDLSPIDLDPEIIGEFFQALRQIMPPQPSSGDGSEDDFGSEGGEAGDGIGGSVTIEVEIVNGILEIEFLGADQIFLAAIVLDPIEELEEELDPEELLATALAEALSEIVTEAGDEPEDDPSPA